MSPFSPLSIGLFPHLRKQIIFARRFFEKKGICPTWHYLRLEEEEWHRRIAKRNAEVLAAGSRTDYLIDENIIRKFTDPADEPLPGEMAVVL